MRKKEILEAIIKYISEHGYPPSVREIGEMANLKSTSSVQRYLKQMIEEGMLETDADYGTPRAIRVPGYEFMKKGEVHG